MNNIQIHNNLSAPHGGRDSELYRLISAKVRVESAQAFNWDGNYGELWNADWWGFSRSSTFNSLSQVDAQRVLCLCNQNLLNEAYFIEKSGLAYCAKMTLAADSTDVAQLYSLIGADEAKHLAWIEPYVKADQKENPSGYFLAFLSNLIESCSPQLLVYLVQIILEGWGLNHYQRLSTGCSNSHLAEVFSRILKDEALHHKSGDMLFDAKKLSRNDLNFAEQALRNYTAMVRVGSQSALSAIDCTAGELHAEQLVEVLEAIDHQVETQRKLDLLKRLMLQPGLEDCVAKLEHENAFAPYSLQEAADFYLSHR